jgi:hypothetical protein
MACFRCGRRGHFASNCFAASTVDGLSLSDSEDSDSSSGREEAHHSKSHTFKKRRVNIPTKSYSVQRPLLHAGVYVLRTTNGMYYVGKSQDISSRIEEHRRGVGATCVSDSSFEVISGLLSSGTTADLESWERNETLHRMRVHGIDNVRGWMFTSRVPFSQEEREEAFRQICEKFDLCRRCGRGSHFADKCFATSFDKWTRFTSRLA